MIEPIRWHDGQLSIIDQTLLPLEEKWIALNNVEAVWEAIKQLRVRGAPAIGISAAFGCVVGVNQREPDSTAAALQALEESADYLATSRPTAVNLFWAIERMREVAREHANAGLQQFRAAITNEAVDICEEDKRRCRAIGENGADLIAPNSGVLTHCNAGGLATGAYGTALAVMFRAHEKGTPFHVYADETRPLLQGARLTTWELMRAGIDVSLICDNMAAQVMKEGRIQLVVTGADRIAANGDAANKIGTYQVAICAKHHGIPFYVAAPLSTIDCATPDGGSIPIEERAAEEVTEGFGKRTAPEGVQVYSPAFDATPADLIAGIITEQGILRPPYTESIAHCFETAQPV